MSATDKQGNVYAVVDADGHAWEAPFRMWDRHLPPAYRGRVWRSGVDPNGHWRTLFDGKLYMQHETGPVPDEVIAREGLLSQAGERATAAMPSGSRAPFGMVPAGHPETSAGRILDMDVEGIDVAVIYPTMALMWLATDKLELAAVCARAQNDILAELARPFPDRLKPVISLPLVQPTPDCVKACVTELNRATSDLGLRAVFLLPSVRKANLDEPVFFPLYEEIQRLGLPIGIHWGSHTHLPGVQDRFRPEQFVLGHAIGFPCEAMIALGSIVCGGLLDRFPDLRWAILESGIGWVPYFMERLDEHYERLPQLQPAMTRGPRDYMRSGRIHYSCDPDERSLPFALEMLGDDLIFYASDYPHWDGRFPRSVEPLRDHPALTPEQKRKVLGGNAARFYGLQTP
jgi:predicted TIM-barrel fold metal-dependent hydrolase